VWEWLQGSQEAVLPSSDAFERCALHSLCAFHGTTSTSILTPTGRQVLARRRLTDRDPAAPSYPPGLEGDQVLCNSMAADAHKRGGCHADAQPGTVTGTQCAGELPYTAVEVLLVLDSCGRNCQLRESALRQHRREHYPPEWGGAA
jgi:hypothetical protein